MLNIIDIKGSIYFNFRKIIKTAEKNNYSMDTYHTPFEKEFSRDEMRYFTNYFNGYLIGHMNYWKKITDQIDQSGKKDKRMDSKIYNFLKKRRKILYQPFVKIIPAEFIIYGCKNEVFFCKQFDEREEYNYELDKIMNCMNDSIDGVVTHDEYIDKIIKNMKSAHIGIKSDFINDSAD